MFPPLALAFTIIDPGIKNPMTEHWERAFRVFDLMLQSTKGDT